MIYATSQGGDKLDAGLIAKNLQAEVRLISNSKVEILPEEGRNKVNFSSGKISGYARIQNDTLYLFVMTEGVVLSKEPEEKNKQLEPYGKLFASLHSLCTTAAVA